MYIHLVLLRQSKSEERLRQDIEEQTNAGMTDEEREAHKAQLARQAQDDKKCVPVLIHLRSY